MQWELLQRARALDNQIFVAACSPARDTSSTYVAWGHSTVIDPLGQVVSTCDEKEGIVYADIDLGMVDETRKGIPCYQQRRHDIYSEVKKVAK